MHLNIKLRWEFNNNTLPQASFSALSSERKKIGADQKPHTPIRYICGRPTAADNICQPIHWLGSTYNILGDKVFYFQAMNREISTDVGGESQKVWRCMHATLNILCVNITASKP